MDNYQTDGLDVVVVGAGIVGTAIAYTAACQGLSVAIFERTPRAVGATIRNFGMVWPVGQPLETFDRAMRSRAIWTDLAEKAGFWAAPTGMLCAAYEADEMQVLEEFVATRQDQGYEIEMLSPEQVALKSDVVKQAGLQGALWSATEVNVDPREALQRIHQYLQEVMGVRIFFHTAVTNIEYPFLTTADNQKWKAERIYVCGGADFETLYPGIFAESGITKCKLQMMRTGPQPQNWKLGPTLCAGLTLAHYGSFAHCISLEALKTRINNQMPEYNRWGIHVLVSQTSLGEVTIGDSHEYGLDLSPFDQSSINQLILNYLDGFAAFPHQRIAETWAGIYAKLPGKTEFIHSPTEGVTIVNGLSGAGMTLSFGLAQELGI